MPVALISAFAKDESLEGFAQRLVRWDFELLGSAGTARFLEGMDVPCRDMSSVVGEPILGHRVVTLSRRIHAALLSRDTEDDQAELQRLGVPKIDLLCVDPYPLKAAMADPENSMEDIREMIDIGGPAMIRAATKGGRIVITSESTRVSFMQLYRPESGLTEEMRNRLYMSAELTCGSYSMLAAAYYAVLAGIDRDMFAAAIGSSEAVDAYDRLTAAKGPHKQLNLTP